MSRNRLLMTQSLLSAWGWQYRATDTQAAEKDFLRTLNRQHTPENQAMRDGIQFENMVAACCDGDFPPQGHKWEDGIHGAAKLLQGCQFQVPVYRDAVVDGINLLLYGRLDGLKAGVIYDLKFSRTYSPGKYIHSIQHPMYFACVPEAKRFDYVVYTGSDICVESYCRGEGIQLEQEISRFIRYLQVTGYDEIYLEKWRAK